MSSWGNTFIPLFLSLCSFFHVLASWFRLLLAHIWCFCSFVLFLFPIPLSHPTFRLPPSFILQSPLTHVVPHWNLFPQVLHSPRTPRQKTPLVQRWESGLVNGHNTEDDWGRRCWRSEPKERGQLTETCSWMITKKESSIRKSGNTREEGGGTRRQKERMWSEKEGQGLRLQRGSGGLGARKRIGGGPKTLKNPWAKRREKEEEGQRLEDKHLACFWYWKTLKLMNVKRQKIIITLNWRNRKCIFRKMQLQNYNQLSFVEVIPFLIEQQCVITSFTPLLTSHNELLYYTCTI